MQSAASAISSNLTEMSAMGAAQMASLLQVQDDLILRRLPQVYEREAKGL